jgi:tetratricopeptide (TPR) repeat protein
MVALQGVLLAGAVVFLLSQVVGIWPTVATKLGASSLHDARTAGNRKRTEKAVRALIKQRPRDGELRLLLARTILAGGDFKKARKEYAAAAKQSASPGHRAAAELGKGVALLAKSTPPSEENLAAAVKAFEKGAATQSTAGDAQTLLAVAHIWAGDLDAARAAVRAAGVAEAKKGTRNCLGLAPSAALACTRAYLAGTEGDAVTASAELRRARFLVRGNDSPIGKYISESMKVFELEAASLPGASSSTRTKLVKHLKAEGPKGIADEKSYPLFFRAAFSCALSKDANHKKVGMSLLARATEDRPSDPMPLIATAVALAREAKPLWREAENKAKSNDGKRIAAGDARNQLLDLLPGGGAAKPGAGRLSKPLKELAKISVKLGGALTKAAARYVSAGDEEGAAWAVDIFEYLFRWHLRTAELSTRASARRPRELLAAAQIVAMKKLLGKRIPATEAAARLLRNAGAIFAKYSAWEEANACFARSLELFSDQPNLKPYAESMRMPPRIVAVYPAKAGELLAGPPLAGVEIALPESINSLHDCKVEASVGMDKGERKAFTPVISGTGLWYVPGEGELADGLVEVRFAITSPLGHKAEAKTSFLVDSSPPEITSRFPKPGSTVTDRHVVIRIGWRDPSGIDPESVWIKLEPVTAAAVSKILVDKGRQKSGRFSGTHTWKSKSSVIPEGSTFKGTIVTGTMSALATGVFRVRVRMRDAMNKMKEDSWKFTVR